MIIVHVASDIAIDIPEGKYYFPDEQGWISILDNEGLAVAVFHKDHIQWVEIKSEDART